MKKRYIVALAVGRVVRYGSMRLGGHGSALPGLVVEKLFPRFLGNTLKTLPVVVVVGTNGKTTTTKIITELLEAKGLRVLSNSSGSNFVRGIISALIQSMSLMNSRLDKDIAILEIDEAYGPIFVEQVAPDYVVALNVMRDQIDRFGELTVTKRLIIAAMQSAKKGCVINANEPELAEVGPELSVPVAYYGVGDNLLQLFPSDAELLMVKPSVKQRYSWPLAVRLQSFEGQKVCYELKNERYCETVMLKGQYNFHNAAAALALVECILPEVTPREWLHVLRTVQPAFGRGETIIVDGRSIEIFLVKNSGSFRQVLRHQADDFITTMIAINDDYADGRDVSWLWDIDFSQYQQEVEIVSGTRASDMALRLKYDNIKVKHLEHNLTNALKQLLAANPLMPARIYCTYTAMLTLRQKLTQLAGLPHKI